jgi:hypothetical protein
MRRPKVLLACLWADFGQNGQMKPDFSNCSWEYENIYKPWKQLADEGVVELETHWLDTQNNAQGFDRLIALAKECDFIFQVAVNHGLSICKPYCDTIRAANIPIVDYPPDVWARFDHHSPENWIVGRFREGYVSHYLSPAKHVIPLMRQYNLPTQYMPFGIPSTCDRLDVEKKYDVSFVGQKHGIRGEVMDAFLKAGIKVHLFGHYWDKYPNWHGRPSPQEMNLIFNQTKVNLNLRWTSRNAERGLVNGRSFELMGAGAFMLASQHAETTEFNDLYIPSWDFSEAHYVNQMIADIMYYSDDDHASSRQAMADRAYQKRDQHLWTTRFKTFLEGELWKRW